MSVEEFRRRCDEIDKMPEGTRGGALAELVAEDMSNMNLEEQRNFSGSSSSASTHKIGTPSLPHWGWGQSTKWAQYKERSRCLAFLIDRISGVSRVPFRRKSRYAS